MICIEQDRGYYKKHKEKKAARAKKYYANNKEKIRIQRAEYFKVYSKDSDVRKKKIAYLREYYKNNKKTLLAQHAEYRKSHKESMRFYSKQYRKDNKKQLAINKAEYFQKNKDKIYVRIKVNYKGYLKQWQRWRQNPKIRLNASISENIRCSLKGNKKGQRWETLVGYNLQQLINHLEKQFQPNMTWKNYGKWHIEHKIPISVFNFDSAKHIDFQRCWSLNNLQPMWASDNFKKHANLDGPFQSSLKLSFG